MRLCRPLCILALAVAAHSAAAGSIAVDHFSELDGTFRPALPGRVELAFDQPGTNFTDIGVNAFSDPNDGRITSVSQVDIANADTNLVGIGLARHLYTGAIDTSFQGTGKRVKDAALTSVVDACIDPNGRIVVAGMTPGANGSGGAKDLALVRFNADGSDDNTFAGDGGVAFTFGDGLGEVDEGIRDVDCLPNGNLLVAGWFDDVTGRNGFVIEMPANGGVSSVRGYALGTTANNDSVVTSATAVGNGIAVTGQIYGETNYVTMAFLSPNGGSYIATPGLPQQNLGAGNVHCNNPAAPQLFGMTVVAENDFVFSGLHSVSGNNVPMLVRVQFGENVLVNCTDVANGVNNAYVTPPVALGNLVVVAAGFQPFGSGPLSSRLSGFVAPANGGALTVAPGFGINGLAQWNFPYSSGNTNNNRSFVQRLYLDPAYSLMAVGTRTWNGADTDTTISRFGSSGVFNDGFETPIQ